jgi:hypothetical protein
MEVIRMSAPTQQEITRLLNAIDRDQRDSDYVDAIKFDAKQIEGTRYRFRLSVTEPER